MKDNNYGSEIACKNCGKTIIKTRLTGNQCRKCRSLRIKSHKPKTYEYKNQIDPKHLEVLNFIDKVLSRGGFIYNLIDISNLIEYWRETSNKRWDAYDMLPTSEQIFNMFTDLKKWKKNIENNV
jgi:hypothetical protein